MQSLIPLDNLWEQYGFEFQLTSRAFRGMQAGKTYESDGTENVRAGHFKLGAGNPKLPLFLDLDSHSGRDLRT